MATFLYTVIPALYQAEGGPEAQVGDQVKLYLDTDAQPGFPEFVTGIIQHPIVRVCDGTQYSVEYDPADLEGAAELLVTGDVVSALVVTEVDLLRDDVEANYAPKASPAFTGTPTAPTASAGTNTTQIATTAFVLSSSIPPINQTVAQSTDLSLSSLHNGKVLAFTGGQTLTLPTPIVGFRCWITIDVGGVVLNFAGENPQIGQGLSTTNMEEGYGTAELEGCAGYWLLKQVSSHKHATSDLDATAVASDTCGGKVVVYNAFGQVSSYGQFNMVYANYSIALGLTTLTANRQHTHPDRDGYVAIVPGYANSTLADAAVSVGEAWFDTTTKKVKVRLV